MAFIEWARMHKVTSQKKDNEIKTDVAKRGELGIKLNNMLTKDSYTIVPLVHRGRVSAHANSLGGVVLNTWDSELWNVADWYRMD